MDSSHDIDQENWMQYDDQEYNPNEGLNVGRQSTCMNEDDYDYAIELKRDDEYRQAADALPNIAELDDVDDDELLVFLDEKRQSVIRTPLTASPKNLGLVRRMRESLSLLQPRPRGGPNDGSNTCRLDQQERDCSVNGIEQSSINRSPLVDVRQSMMDVSSSPKLSPCSKLSDASSKLEAGLLDDPPSPNLSNTWRLSSILEATTVSLQRAASGVRSWRAKEPSNPVTTLFEPHSMLSRKGLLMHSTKSKVDGEGNQSLSSKSSDGKSYKLSITHVTSSVNVRVRVRYQPSPIYCRIDT